MATKRKRKPKANPGRPRFSAQGFYVEGRQFKADHIEFACAFAAKLMRAYSRPVDVYTCVIPGAAFQSFRYVPADSFESAAASPDKHGHVIICHGKTIVGV